MNRTTHPFTDTLNALLAGALERAEDSQHLRVLLAYVRPALAVHAAELLQASSSAEHGATLQDTLWILCADENARAHMVRELAARCGGDATAWLGVVRCGNVLCGAEASMLDGCFRMQEGPGLLSLGLTALPDPEADARALRAQARERLTGRHQGSGPLPSASAQAAGNAPNAAALQGRVAAALDMAAVQDLLAASGRKKDAALLTRGDVTREALRRVLACAAPHTTGAWAAAASRNRAEAASPVEEALRLMAECLQNGAPFHWEAECPHLCAEADARGEGWHPLFHGIWVGRETPPPGLPPARRSAQAIFDGAARMPKTDDDARALCVAALALHAVPGAHVYCEATGAWLTDPSHAWLRRLLWRIAPPLGMHGLPECTGANSLPQAEPFSKTAQPAPGNAQEATPSALILTMRRAGAVPAGRGKTPKIPKESPLTLPVHFTDGSWGNLSCRASELALVEPETLCPPSGLRNEGDWKLLLKLHKAQPPLDVAWLNPTPGADPKEEPLRSLLREDFSPDAVPFYEADMIAPYDGDYNAPAFWLDRADLPRLTRSGAAPAAMQQGTLLPQSGASAAPPAPAQKASTQCSLFAPGPGPVAAPSKHASPASQAPLPRLAVTVLIPATDEEAAADPQPSLHLPAAALIPAEAPVSATLLATEPHTPPTEAERAVLLRRLLFAEALLNARPVAWMLAAHGKTRLARKTLLRLPLPQPSDQDLQTQPFLDICRNALLINAYLAPERFVPLAPLLNLGPQDVPHAVKTLDGMREHNEQAIAALYGLTPADRKRMRPV